MDAGTSYEPVFELTDQGDATSSTRSRLAFLFAMPGALDIIICDEPDEPTGSA